MAAVLAVAVTEPGDRYVYAIVAAAALAVASWCAVVLAARWRHERRSGRRPAHRRRGQ